MYPIHAGSSPAWDSPLDTHLTIEPDAEDGAANPGLFPFGLSADISKARSLTIQARPAVL